MKQFVKADLLLALVGLTCFAVIYTGSGILTTRKGDKVKHHMPPGQRYLCEPDQDALMMNPNASQDLIEAFNATVYLPKSKSKQQEVARFLVVDHGLKYPLHISVETNAEVRPDGSSFRRELKGIYYYKKN